MNHSCVHPLYHLQRISMPNFQRFSLPSYFSNLINILNRSESLSELLLVSYGKMHIVLAKLVQFKGVLPQELIGAMCWLTVCKDKRLKDISQKFRINTYAFCLQTLTPTLLHNYYKVFSQTFHPLACLCNSWTFP